MAGSCTKFHPLCRVSAASISTISSSLNTLEFCNENVHEVGLAADGYCGMVARPPEATSIKSRAAVFEKPTSKGLAGRRTTSQSKSKHRTWEREVNTGPPVESTIGHSNTTRQVSTKMANHIAMFEKFGAPLSRTISTDSYLSSLKPVTENAMARSKSVNDIDSEVKRYTTNLNITLSRRPIDGSTLIVSQQRDASDGLEANKHSMSQSIVAESAPYNPVQSTLKAQTQESTLAFQNQSLDATSVVGSKTKDSNSESSDCVVQSVADNSNLKADATLVTTQSAFEAARAPFHRSQTLNSTNASDIKTSVKMKTTTITVQSGIVDPPLTLMLAASKSSAPKQKKPLIADLKTSFQRLQRFFSGHNGSVANSVAGNAQPSPAVQRGKSNPKREEEYAKVNEVRQKLRAVHPSSADNMKGPMVAVAKSTKQPQIAASIETLKTLSVDKPQDTDNLDVIESSTLLEDCRKERPRFGGRKPPVKRLQEMKAMRQS